MGTIKCFVVVVVVVSLFKFLLSDAESSFFEIAVALRQYRSGVRGVRKRWGGGGEGGGYRCAGIAGRNPSESS